MDHAEILKTEYLEAGQSCRAQEGYVRTTLNMFLTLSTAVAGFLALAQIGLPAKAFICAVTAGIALCMLLLVLRHRKIYRGLLDRARQIEAELGMSLYSQTPLSGGFDTTAKTISAFIIGLIGAAYLVAAIVIACKT
jgi:hypothetical protein